MSLNKDGELHVDASIYSANNLISSDIRLKKNILPLNNAILTINKLNPVSYNKKTDVKSSEYNISENGFIAQEFQKVLPNLVHESNDKEKILSVNYTAIIPILTKGIQEQQNEIENLRKELNELKKIIISQKKKK